MKTSVNDQGNIVIELSPDELEFVSVRHPRSSKVDQRWARNRSNLNDGRGFTSMVYLKFKQPLSPQEITDIEFLTEGPFR